MSSVRLTGIAAAVAALLACSTLHAAPIAFTGTLSGAAETPPNASPATGTFLIELDPDADMLRVEASFQGLGSPTTAAHVHCCIASPSNAGVATMVPTFAGFPLGVTNGFFAATYDTANPSTWNPAFLAAHGGTAAGAEAALLAGLQAGEAYFNVHTALYPGGEIRGFAAAVPAPGALALLALGLLGAGAVRRVNATR